MTTFWLILVFLVCVWFLHSEVFKLLIFKPAIYYFIVSEFSFFKRGPIPSKGIKVFSNFEIIDSCFSFALWEDHFLFLAFLWYIQAIMLTTLLNSIFPTIFLVIWLLYYNSFMEPFFWHWFFSISVYVKIYSDYSSVLSSFSPKNVPGEAI